MRLKVIDAIPATAFFFGLGLRHLCRPEVDFLLICFKLALVRVICSIW